MDRYYEYETLQGDTFDMIALDFYNNEFLSSKIIEANPEQRTVLVFGAGIKLKVPVIEQQAASTLPPWKR